MHLAAVEPKDQVDDAIVRECMKAKGYVVQLETKQSRAATRHPVHVASSRDAKPDIPPGPGAGALHAARCDVGRHAFKSSSRSKSCPY